VNGPAGRSGLSQSNVPNHLRVPKHAGVVDMRSVAQRRGHFVARPFWKRLQKHGPVPDCGCCSFDLPKLPDGSRLPRRRGGGSPAPACNPPASLTRSARGHG